MSSEVQQLSDEKISELYYASRFSKDEYDGGSQEFARAIEQAVRAQFKERIADLESDKSFAVAAAKKWNAERDSAQAEAKRLREALTAVDEDWSLFWPLGPEVPQSSDRVASVAPRTAEIWRQIRAALQPGATSHDD